jgi:alpha-L-rhamnosidase
MLDKQTNQSADVFGFPRRWWSHFAGACCLGIVSLAAFLPSSQLTCAAAEVKQKYLQPAGLQVEYQTEPLGIGTNTPRFSWKLSDPNFTQGQKQTAYKILVASGKTLLSEGKADVWKSGKVESAQSVLVPYGGPNNLKSSREYYWKAQVFDKDGKPSAWSEPARFATGFLNPSDWDGAAWIKHPSARRSQHLWFRKNIHLGNEPRAIFAHVASLGHHELYINGQKVDDSVLAPALTNFQKRLLYVTYDISKFLKKGDNTIAVWFSSGWTSYDCFKLTPLLRIKIAGLDSANQTVAFNSDTTWRCAVSNSADTAEVFRFGSNGGEIVDARGENPNWNKPDFDDSRWENAVAKNYNTELSPQDIPPSRIIEKIPAKKITDLGNGKYKIDFGKNFTGWLNLKFHGLSAGDKITIGSADDEKSFCDFNIRNFFIASGKDGEAFQNRFNYVAGRYANLELSKFKTNSANSVIEIEKAVYGKLDEPAATVDATEAVKKIVAAGRHNFAVGEITKAVGDPKFKFVKTLAINYKMDGKPRAVSVKDGEAVFLTGSEWKQPPRLEDCVAYAVSSDLKRTGHFKSSNELFNKIYEADIWTFFANTQEGYTSDCPHRERCGYGEVATACSWGLGLPNLDAGAYYRKVIRDWADVQTGDGWGRHTAPQPHNGHWGGPMWSSAGMNVAMHHYQHYGDKKIIEAVYPTAKRWLEFLHANTKDGLLRQYHKHNNGHFLGDWIAPHSRSEFGTSIQAAYFNNCVYAMNLETFVGFAKLLGRAEDVALYKERLEKLRPEIHAKFYNAENAAYCTGTQVQNAFALLTKVAPDGERARVAAYIHNDLNGKHPYFDMGSSGLVVLLKHFVAHSEEAKTVAKVLNKTEFPGYGYFIDKGESTWPEDWKINVPSKIHTCYTGIAGWLVKGLCGIQPGAGHSGYKHFVIRPAIVAEATFAEAAVESPYGRIFCRWTRSEDGGKGGEIVTLSVIIPPSTTATVYVNEKPVEVAAGKYEFRWKI